MIKTATAPFHVEYAEYGNYAIFCPAAGGTMGHSATAITIQFVTIQSSPVNGDLFE